MNNHHKYHLLICTCRLRLGVTQADRVERINEIQSFVSKCESAEQRLYLYGLEIICNVLGITLLDFIRIYIES